MIGHHGIGTNVYSKDLGEGKNLIVDPLPPMFKAFAGMAILSTQKGAPNAARDAMVVGSGV